MILMVGTWREVLMKGCWGSSDSGWVGWYSRQKKVVTHSCRRRPARGTHADLMSGDNFSLCFGTVGTSVITIIRPHHRQMINVSGCQAEQFPPGPRHYYVTPMIICQDFWFVPSQTCNESTADPL